MLKVATLDSLAEPTLNITVLGLYSSISRVFHNSQLAKAAMYIEGFVERTMISEYTSYIILLIIYKDQ